MLTVIAAAVSIDVINPACGAEESRVPNIILILADDVGVETLGCYGGQSYDTPRLDALAQGGMRFNHCYSMYACHPTRVSLLTGRYPFRFHDAPWGGFSPSAESETVAHVLKQAGYTTAIAGKWQLAMMKNDLQHPTRLGFDQWCLFGWHEGPRYWQPMIYQNGQVRDDVQDRYGPDVYVEFLVDFMTKNRDQPFFAYYSMALCHDVTDDLPQPVPFAPDKDRYESYAEMIDQMDRHVGMMLDALDRLELTRKTVVIFTGDNGTSKTFIADAEDGKLIRQPVFSRINGRTVQGGKTELTDAGTNVPLVVRWPGKVEAGQVVDDLVDCSDFLPTLAEVAGASPPEDVQLDGSSFAGRLQGGGYTPRRRVYSERRRSYWVRDQRWKLYNDSRLFDMQSDPEEKEAIDPDEESPDATAARRRLQKVQHELRPSD